MNLKMAMQVDDDNPVIGDLMLTDGQVTLTEDLQTSVMQHLYVRLRLFLGEWFLNTAEGIPYFTRILVKNPSLSLITSIFRRVILETPGVASVSNLKVELDGATRTLSMTSFEITLTDGAVLTADDYGEFVLGGV